MHIRRCRKQTQPTMQRGRGRELALACRESLPAKQAKDFTFSIRANVEFNSDSACFFENISPEIVAPGGGMDGEDNRLHALRLELRMHGRRPCSGVGRSVVPVQAAENSPGDICNYDSISHVSPDVDRRALAIGDGVIVVFVNVIFQFQLHVRSGEVRRRYLGELCRVSLRTDRDG